jgi:hypothetical protein
METEAPSIKDMPRKRHAQEGTRQSYSMDLEHVRLVGRDAPSHEAPVSVLPEIGPFRKKYAGPFGKAQT